MQPLHASISQPPIHTAVGKRPQGASPQPRPLLSLSAQGCTHALKLRDAFKLGPQLQLELGVDLAVSASAGSHTASKGSSNGSASGSSGHPADGSPTNGSAPAHEAQPADGGEPAATAAGLHVAGTWAALQWQLDPEDRGKGVLRADPHHLCFSRRFCLGRKGAWWAVPLDAKLGVTYAGRPHVALGTSNLPLALGLAAALLVAGKPVHLAHKEVGGLALHFPLSFGGTRHQECLQEQVEVDLTVRRTGRSLRCELHQLNGVVRLREE